MLNIFFLFLVIAYASAISWPNGRYSLPKPIDGCPLGWETGCRYQDNEDTHNINSVYPNRRYHFFGTFKRNTLMCYCIKTTDSGNGSWPSGNYCIARKGGSCPAGFCTGHIYWDDEDNANTNSKSGILPDGVYDRNTKTYYCCRSDGSAYRDINLPTSKPFYLYQYTSLCQHVRGMIVHEESITMDDEDDQNNSSDDGCHPIKTDTTEVHYCYYSLSSSK